MSGQSTNHPLTPFRIGSLEIPHRLILAPMCGITHKAFRRVCKEYGAGLVVNQMVSAKALVMGDKKSRRMLQHDESERPVALQLFGNNAEDLAEAAAIAQDTGVDLIDLNMGCPAKKIVNDGGGSALLNDLSLVRKVFEKMRGVLKIPFTVKMRAGWDQRSNQAFAVAQMAQNSGLNAVALHARSRAQGYSGEANWDLIKQLKSQLSIPVIGNGDVETFDDAYRMLRETGCDAVMTGRAATGAPWIFKSFVEGKEYRPSVAETRDLIFRQYDYFFGLFGVPSGIKQMRKHLCFYSKGLRDGAEFRNRAVRMDEWPQIKKTVENFFHVS
ncbi:MAG: tRNA dihydrouridine synthase DusB [Deltaproteobacteria bacterium]|nr:tRNA dihydrouridine synthase DusB [Deltaproteobacteria bacterium]